MNDVNIEPKIFVLPSTVRIDSDATIICGWSSRVQPFEVSWWIKKAKKLKQHKIATAHMSMGTETIEDAFKTRASILQQKQPHEISLRLSEITEDSRVTCVINVVRADNTRRAENSSENFHVYCKF